MTSATSNSYNNNDGGENAVSKEYLANFFHKDLFLNNLRRNKTLMIIIGIVLTCACPLVGYLIVLNGGYISYSLAEGLGISLFIFMMLFALILGLSTMNYTHNKISSIFYNSLPIKKSCLFTTQFISGIVYFFIPLAIVYIPSILLFLGDGSSAGEMTTGFLWAALMFILTYSFTVFSAGISGTMFNSIIILMYFNFYLLSVLGLIGFFIDTFYSFASANFLLNESVMTKTSPLIYYIYQRFISDFTPVDVIGIILFSAAFYAGSLFLNKINKTENAGKSINFKLFERIFKYSMLALTALLGGTLFATMNDGRYDRNYVMFFFGILIFVLITFMLMNFIIHRNIREVFKGLKSLGVFTVIVCVMLSMLSFDVFGFDRYMPNVNSVSSVNLWSSIPESYSNFQEIYRVSKISERMEMRNSISSSDKNVNDPKTISLIYDLFKAAMKADAVDYSYSPTDSLYYDNSEKLRFYNDVSFKLGNGSTVKKKMPYYLRFKNQQDYDEYDSLINQLFSDDGWRKILFAPILDDSLITTLLNPSTRILQMSASVDMSYEYRDYLYGGDKEVTDYSYGSVIVESLNISQIQELFDAAKKDMTDMSIKSIMGYSYSAYDYSINLTVSYQTDDAGTEYVNNIYFRASRDGDGKFNYENLVNYLENNFEFMKN